MSLRSLSDIRSAAFLIALLAAGCVHCDRVDPLGPTVCEGH
jgi:hypothetical protein